MGFTQDWFSQNIPNWDILLQKFKDKPDLKFLEIGCFEGRATEWLLQNILTNKSSSITCIDTFLGSQDHKDFNINVEGMEERFKENILDKYSDQVKLLKGISQLVLRELKDTFDFIYIDGSHVAPDVLEDTILSWSLLKMGGMMIWDDYLWFVYNNITLNPHPAIEAFLFIYRGKFKLLHIGYQVVVEKIV